MVWSEIDCMKDPPMVDVGQNGNTNYRKTTSKKNIMVPQKGR